MSYRLEAGETIDEGLKRIAHEQVDQALESLRQPGDDPDAAIHDARKRFKKTRAVMRLVRDEVGGDVYRRENRFYRDAGRRLSDLRDSYVMIETVDNLAEHFAGQLEPDAFAATRARLVDEHRALRARVVEEEEVPAEVADEVEAGRGRIAALPIGRRDFGAVRDSLHRVYKRGYRGFANAYQEPLPENFHEWRKRVKYLWYHIRILHPLWPDLFEEWADQIHDLSDYLGDAHDLAELQALLDRRPDLCPDPAERQLLLGLADRRRVEWESASHPLGQRIYSESPEDFVQRMAGYWQAWQEEGAVESRPEVITAPS